MKLFPPVCSSLLVSSTPIAAYRIPSRRQVLVVLYAASGAAALVYEITWTRLLTLHLGHSVAAASTVLAAFMGGLAARIVDRGSCRAASGKRARGTCTSFAFASTPLSRSSSRLPRSRCRRCCRHAYRCSHGRITTPRRRYVSPSCGPCSVSCSSASRRPRWARPFRSSSAGMRVAPRTPGCCTPTNTAGAALGAVAAGFWLHPRGRSASHDLGGHRPEPLLGRRRAVAGVHGYRRGNRGTDQRRGLRRNNRATVVTWIPATRLGMAAAAISGFTALVYEVCWTRLLALVIGPTTYAFTTVVASFIIGVAIGSAAGARLVRRTSQPVMWLGGMLMLTAVASSMASWFASSRLPLIVASQVSDPGAAFGGIFARQAFGIAILLLPMTCALGATFSLALATALAGRPGDRRRRRARVWVEHARRNRGRPGRRVRAAAEHRLVQRLSR